MIYLSKITLPMQKPDHWPFTVGSLQALTSIEFKTPVTFIAGDNGTGKSTLIESLAVKLKLPSVGRTDASYDESLKELHPLARLIRNSFSHKPRNKFFLRSEDFFNFVLKLNQEQNEISQDLRRVEDEYKDKSVFTQNQARQAYANSQHQMKRLYGNDLLSNASHGESFIRLFNSRITPNGLYILDEPEVPLSPLRQLSLLSIIKDMSENHNSQFIIATHSPILLAYDKAMIYCMDDDNVSLVKWEELESVQLMKDFLNCPNRYIDRL